MAVHTPALYFTLTKLPHVGVHPGSGRGGLLLQHIVAYFRPAFLRGCLGAIRRAFVNDTLHTLHT